MIVWAVHGSSKMNSPKTITNAGIACTLFTDQKYRFLREMASINIMLPIM